MLYNLATSLSRFQKQAIVFAADLALIGLSYRLAIALLPRQSGELPWAMGIDLIVLACTGGVLTLFLGLHRIKLNAYQMQGVMYSAVVAIFLAVSGIAATLSLANVTTPPQVFVVSGMLFLILTVTARLVMRQALLRIYNRGTPRVPILIYGAGQTGQQLATALATDDAVTPVAFVDDNPRLQGLTIAGLRVHPASEINEMVAQHRVERIVLAMPSVPQTVQANISRSLSETGCEVHLLPSFAELIVNSASGSAGTKAFDISDLLGRDGLDKDLPGVSDSYTGRNVLVTGAGGSIGSELCRQIVECRPTSLILLDHSELMLFQIDRELRDMAPDVDIQPVLGSICEEKLVTGVMAKYKIDIVLHAAAYKHVPLVESNALEGMRNNVLGTKTVAEAARAAGVERFILVSTDKAVRPSSMMGASKRFAELVVQDLATRSTTTRFAMVRFGNVLGSSGSVIPLFQEQISRGGPVKLTHPDVTRYFMTIPAAVRLVLLAGSFARGGDLFVLDMGKPVSIHQLARQMIESAGYTVRNDANPEGDIEIQITGLRPGEKLHEELLIGSDMLTTPHPRILRAQEKHLSELETAKALKAMRQAIDTRDPKLLSETLSEWIERGENADPLSVNE